MPIVDQSENMTAEHCREDFSLPFKLMMNASAEVLGANDGIVSTASLVLGVDASGADHANTGCK